MTAATRVCCSMISETQMRYGSVVPRHGRSRASARYHAISPERNSTGSISDVKPFGPTPLGNFEPDSRPSLSATAAEAPATCSTGLDRFPGFGVRSPCAGLAVFVLFLGLPLEPT